jgi:DNA-binding beta-propeller fold protein YncE
VRAWDVSDPTEPFVVSHAAFATGARHLEVDGQHLYVADTGVGLRIFDVSQPTVLTHAGTVGTPHVATDVTVSEGFAYVADDWSGVRVIDVSDPESATEVDFYDTGHWARGVAEANGLVFVADGYDGIYVIDNRPPASIPASPRSSARLLPARPNPFQNSTQIGFSLALGGRAVVEVFDPTGRRIRTLYDGELPAGKYEVIWDGVDDAGVPAPSGIYYHRIESTEGAAVGRLVLMR